MTRIKQRFLAFDDRVKKRDEAESDEVTSPQVPSTLPCKTSQRQWKKAIADCRERDTLPF